MPSTGYTIPDSSVKTDSYRLRQRSWGSTPNFHEVPRRDLPVNSYQDYQYVDVGQTARSASTIFNGDTGATTVVNPAGFQFSGAEIRSTYDAFELNWGRPAWHPLITPAYDNAVIRILNKAGDMKSNLAVTLAEARKTSELILTTATRYANAYRAFRKGRFGDVAHLLNIKPKSVHKTWLEYKYGWMPLLMDVKNSAEFFAQQNFHGGRTPRFKVSAKFSVGDGDVSPPVNVRKVSTYGAFGGGESATYVETYNAIYHGRLSMTLEVVNPNVTVLQQLGLTNPALVVWELVPYSFVFDWFVSVGDWLSAMTAIRGLRVVRPMVSGLTEERYFYVQPATTRVNAPNVYSNAEFLFRFIKREYGRFFWTVPELPRVPTKFDMGFAQMTTSLALLRSNFRGSRTTRV